MWTYIQLPSAAAVYLFEFVVVRPAAEEAEFEDVPLLLALLRIDQFHEDKHRIDAGEDAPHVEDRLSCSGNADRSLEIALRHVVTEGINTQRVE
jgi:hypothetical protein